MRKGDRERKVYHFATEPVIQEIDKVIDNRKIRESRDTYDQPTSEVQNERLEKKRNTMDN